MFFTFSPLIRAEVVPCHSPDVWWPQPGTHAAGLMSLAVKSWVTPMTVRKHSSKDLENKLHSLIATPLNRSLFYAAADPVKLNWKSIDSGQNMSHVLIFASLSSSLTSSSLIIYQICVSVCVCVSPPGVLRRWGFLRAEPRRPLHWPHWVDAEQRNVSTSYLRWHVARALYCHAYGSNRAPDAAVASGSRHNAPQVRSSGLCGALCGHPASPRSDLTSAASLRVSIVGSCVPSRPPSVQTAGIVCVRLLQPPASTPPLCPNYATCAGEHVHMHLTLLTVPQTYVTMVTVFGAALCN